MQWASVFGLDRSVVCPLQTLFKRLGLTYAQGRRAWDVLIDRHTERQERFVEIERLPTSGRGRPRSRYRLSAKLVKALQRSPSAPEHHAAEIAMLAKTTLLSAENMTKDLSRDGLIRRSRLTLPNRWLLMVLLAHADTPSVVTRLGISKMRHLTGMSRARIDRQLKKLRDLGLIAHHQPGRYSFQASVRKTSIYLLNLTHPLMGEVNREFINICYLPSSAQNKRTGLVDGIVDAVMTVGVCSLQMDSLLKEYEAVQASGSTTSESNGEGIAANYDPFQLDQKYQDKYTKLEIMQKHALALLQIKRDRSDDIGKRLRYCDAELLNNYDSEDANWLLTSVHIDTARLLSSAWCELEKGLLGPEQPSHDIIVGTARRLGLEPAYTIEESHDNETRVGSGEDYAPSLSEYDEPVSRSTVAAPQAKKLSYHPLALLFYALSHYLAKKLQTNSNPDRKMAFESMSYTLFPVFTKPPSKQQLLAFKLHGYGNKNLDISNVQLVIPLVDPVGENLKTYWQTHQQDCLSAISDEPDDSTSDSLEPADQ
ncbi:hypothetical protein [Vreelandella titanicae]|uniref:hypothetical protein n=1 Tax=Vreelandella titanicae TaxID=664683 RepID=UPI0016818C39|nr:hypothetical protein [Halomonas titanicae]QNU63675.1 hypothetical protein HZS52_04785 [Halomonas titanicae]